MADAKKLLGGLDKIGKRLLAQKEAEEGGLNAIRSAGRTAHEREAAMRAAKNAQVKEQLANLPARNKKANEALGLYHPVGGGLKLSRPTSGMHATTVADPKFNPPDIGIITPEQLVKEQAALFPLVGDRAAAGRYLTHVGENELDIPVRLTGGPRYMDANYNKMSPEESAAWESGLGRTTALGRQAERAGEGGRPVYGIYTAGSGTNTDFNVMGANALLQQIPFSKITKKAEREFDQAMRNGTEEFPPIPNWPGIRSPDAQALILDKSNGIARTKMFGVMGKENFQSMGFPDVPSTRKAIIEPELLDIPTNEAGFRLARMDATGRIIENPNIPSDYPAAMAGQVAGKLDVPADYKDVFQTHFDARRLLSKPESGDYYSFSRAHPIQYADEEWLNRLMEKRLANERKIKEGEYKKGGAVNIEEADQRLKEAIQKRMAKGGGVNIEEADAKLRASIQARMGMAQGGEVGFKKIQFMDKGGKVGKLASGVAAVGKRLLADEAPKPTAPPAPRNVSAGDVVNGMLVRKDIPNTSSIGASLSDYSTHGLQEVPMSAFETVGKPRYRSVQEEKRTKELARQIQENKELNPLIVVKDAEGHYILEGGHRFDALRELGIDSFPALMVHDLESLANVVAPAVKKAEGGGAFKKLEFMDKGGKVGKLAQGVASVGKRLLADNSLPALEREANLQKFLAESKTPMRLYHGTTATEGGKGTEAIRRIKPSKEGALGSGVYTTPNTAHASSYTGIPNDDAIEAMRGSEYYSKMADQFMADRAAGRLREGQAGGNMLPVHVQMRNPLIIGKSGRNIDPAADALMSLGMDEASAIKLVEKAFEEKGNIGKQIQSRAQAQGYDGIMQYRGDDLSEVVSYNPNAVKSAIGNQGTYDINQPDLSKAEGGPAFKKLQFMDKGGITTSAGSFSPEELGVTANDLRLIDDKTLQRIKNNAPATYDWIKQNIKDEASQLKTPRGVKDFALRVGASYAGGIPDLLNLGAMGVDLVQSAIPSISKPESVLDVADSKDRIPKFKLASDKPWFGSQQYIDAMHKAGALGESEFPIAEGVATVLMPAGLIKKGIKKGAQLFSGKKPEELKKRRGGLAAMAR